MSKNECGGCGLTFGSLGAFDKHRVGSYGDPIYQQTSTGKRGKFLGYEPSTRRCLTVEEIIALGWKQEKHGWWITGETVSFGSTETELEEIEEEEREVPDPDEEIAS